MRIEFRYRFEAAHRFLNSDSKTCMTPHGHTWFATLFLDFIGTALNSSQMTVEFSELKKPWRQLIQETFDHSYMHNIKDSVAEMLRSESSEYRFIPFPGDPTTELIALFMFQKMQTVLSTTQLKGLVQINAIALEETPTNKVICDRSFFLDQISRYQDAKSWWNSSNIADRSFGL